MSGLRILVPVKRVLDYTLKPRINKTNSAIDNSGFKHSMNPFDELSVEESVRLREKHSKDTVTDILAFSCGPAKSADTLRTAMAMGADRSLLVETAEKDEPLEPLQIAKLLKEIVQKEDRNLVILGKQSIDDDMSQTGQMLAGLLGWGQACGASEVTLEEGGEYLRVRREVDGGTEIVRSKLPMVVTTDLRLNEPRYASLPNIMKAKKKPMEKKKLSDFEISAVNRLKVLKVEEPPKRQGGGKVADVDGLIAKLKELGAL